MVKTALITAIGRIFDNKHTSVAALVWLACKLGAIWLPQWKDKFDATEAVAVGYGLFMAGDAKPQLTASPPPNPIPKPE